MPAARRWNVLEYVTRTVTLSGDGEEIGERLRGSGVCGRIGRGHFASEESRA
jgi:hypothetical protein